MSASFARAAVPLMLCACATSAVAQQIDLSSWQSLTLDFPGVQPAGNWVLDAGNTSVRQIVNSDPSFFLNSVNQGSYTLRGTWQVVSGSGDDDYMGFAFGYQNSSNFYLFDWKAGTQLFDGRTAAEGMTIKRFTGATGSGLVDLSINEFWENQVSFGDMTVLATNHSSTAGWVSGRPYTFQLDFNTTPGQFTIQVLDGTTTLWDRTVVDSNFTSGQFAFYNNSQSGVRYAGFEQFNVTDPVPEPETYALLLIGLTAVAAAAKRRR